VETELDPQRTVEADLRLTVERFLARRGAPCASVAGIERLPSPFATLFPADVLSVRLTNGDSCSVFVKSLGPEQADHPDKQVRDREILVYETLLADADLPVARYLGSRWNERTGRREVFLEHIDDWNLKYHDLEHWYTAARQLARLHRHFAQCPEKLRGCPFLLHLDGNYGEAWAHRALAAVGRQSADLARRFGPVVRDYNAASAFLSAQPPTLVHNDLAPKNVIADRSQLPARICFVDWEMAGVGCGVLDLVHLTYGLDPESERRMRATYGDELAGSGLLPPNAADADRLFAACELHKTVSRLAFSEVWRLPLERVAEWITEARELLDRVRGRSPVNRAEDGQRPRLEP
jgi:hypothetical protein